jgi:hypothetical protein
VGEGAFLIFDSLVALSALERSRGLVTRDHLCSLILMLCILKVEGIVRLHGALGG